MEKKKDYKVLFKQKKGLNGADLLLFEGCLNVQHALEIRKSLSKKWPKTKVLHLKVTQVTQLDLSFLQLLMALQFKLKEQGGSVFFDLELEKKFEDTIMASGFGNLLPAKN